MKRACFLFAVAMILVHALARAQQPAQSPNTLRFENGTVANGDYTNECLGFSFPIPVGWEVNNEALGTMPEGTAKRAPGGGLILLVLDQRTGRPFRNRIVLSALNTTGFKTDTEGFVSKFVRDQFNRKGLEMVRETYGAEFAGKHFFRADFKDSGPEGTLYQTFVATKFRAHFLGWTLVSPSPDDLEESTKALQRISFRGDQPDARCVVGGEGVPKATGIAGDIPGGATGGEIGSIAEGSDSGRPLRVRVSQGVSQALLIKKVQPQYPDDARQSRIEGLVVLKALINTNGDVRGLTLVSGHPVLAPAALDAVKQWKYKPYLLNGQPVEIETQVTVSFQLSGK